MNQKKLSTLLVFSLTSLLACSGLAQGLGGRGGFDPSKFLDRLDRNGNGMLDMDEREGPAGFMIGRMQRENPNMKTDRPIPIKEIKEAFEKMRGGGSRGGDSRGGRGGDDDDDQPSALEAGLLVPGFGEASTMVPVPGFGSTAELFDVEIRPEDEREAEERMRRYDRNKDGFLTSDELSSRWEGNPMDFDRNRDGKLSVAELSVRYARRREGGAQSRDDRRDSRDRGRDRDRRRKEDPVDPYNGAKSFLNLGVPTGGDLPELFQEKDKNADRQVSMNEFASEWNEQKIGEFYALDLNQDGVITLAEFQAPPADPSESKGDSSGSSDRGSRGASGSAASSSAAMPNVTPADQEKYLSYAKRIIARADGNKDGKLQKDEWGKMLIDPSGADYDKDLVVTPEEYAKFMLMKSKK